MQGPPLRIRRTRHSTGDFGPSNVALLVGQWVLPGRQNSVRLGRKPRETSKIDQTLRSGSFEFDLFTRACEALKEEPHQGRRSTLGPRWVNRGSPIFGKNRQPWVPATSFLFLRVLGNQTKLSTFDTVAFRVRRKPDRFHALRRAPPLHSPCRRECCLLVLNLVSSTLSCIRQPRPQ